MVPRGETIQMMGLREGRTRVIPWSLLNLSNLETDFRTIFFAFRTLECARLCKGVSIQIVVKNRVFPSAFSADLVQQLMAVAGLKNLPSIKELQRRVRELEEQLKNPQQGQAHKAGLSAAIVGLSPPSSSSSSSSSPTSVLISYSICILGTGQSQDTSPGRRQAAVENKQHDEAIAGISDSGFPRKRKEF